jgi:hypothetical protein
VESDTQRDGYIRCQLEVFHMRHAPPYDALSYVWNDTHPVMSRHDINSKNNTKTILCNGQQKEIGPSLYAALIALKVTPAANHFEPSSQIVEVDADSSWETRSSEPGQENPADRVFIVERERIAWPSLHAIHSDDKLEEYIWVDALSINQSDIQERNKQVSIMRDIYRNAKSTVVWLGDGRNIPWDSYNMHKKHIPEPAEADISGLCSTLRAFTSAYKEAQKHHAVSAGPPKPPFLPLCQAVSNSLPNDKALHLCTDDDDANFFNRKWYTRVWILQEVAVATRIRMFYGDYEINHNAVALAASWLFCTGFDFQGDPDSGFSNLPFNHAAYICGKLCSTGNENETPLAELILHTLYFDATDPRDKIYALLGISAEESCVSTLKPDYDMSVRDVYIAATKYILQSTQSLDILSGVLHSQNRPSRLHNRFRKHDRTEDAEILELPSWVPNLSHIEYSAAHHFMSGLWCCGFRASGTLRARIEPFHSDDPEILRLSGVIVDRISFAAPLSNGEWAHWVIGRPYDYWAEGPTGPFIEMALPMLAECCRYYYPGEDCGCFTQHAIHGMAEHPVWKDFGGETGKKHYRTGESVLKAFTLTACAGQTYYGEGVGDSKEWAADCREYWERQMGNCKNQDETRRSRRQDMIEKSLNRAAWGRRMFQTSGGLLGLGPEDLLKDDLVVVLFGGKTPYILRGVDDGMYQLVGEAYVHGIMAGEGVEEVQCSAEGEAFGIV